MNDQELNELIQPSEQVNDDFDAEGGPEAVNGAAFADVVDDPAFADIDDPADDDYAFDDEDEEEDDEDDEDEDGADRYRYMQNRELSWLTFNERVLDQGADESVPLLQRLNFISIFWSNLQEFFMVRVGSLTDLSFIEPPVQDSKTGMTPKEQIRAIHERCAELYPIQESYYEHVRGSLAKEGVRHLRPEDISDEQRNYLFGLVQHNIEPFLSPQIINSRHPFPHLENGKLYILVRLDDEASEAERKKRKKEKGKKKEKGAAEGVQIGLIPLPHQCDRIIKLPGRGFQFILLEHAIEMFVPEIFHMYKIKHTNVICVTRNADIDANQGFDEQDEDYREHMKRLLKKRARLAPVRLECERPLSPVMEKLMLNKLGLKRFQVYDTIVPLDLSFTWGLGSRLSEKKCEKLSDAPFSPAWPTCFDKSTRIMDQVLESDRETLLFYPYESMDPFVQLLREASVDPDVVSIKITLYRLASQSHLAEALIAAADAGKEVTALFELRARFDENNNIEWSQRFEEAGCNVIYGFRDYKVHSKICCITRRTADGGVQHITQLGTGNYNEKTAKLYTDLSFITTSEEFGRDAVEFFRNMQLENVSDNYRVLRVAPLQIKPLILDNLDAQIANARAGKPAVAFMKANSITDKDVIEKISEASNAGVKITLFVRGICCLVPDVKGATENVRVVSIVGRLLEHSRIYCFGTGDDCVVYLSSADLMTRNLNKRVEIAWPILDPELRERVLTYMDICLSDTAKLRELRKNSTYTPLGALCDIDDEGNAKPAFDSQATLIDQATEAARIMSEIEAKAKAEAEEQARLEAEAAAEAEAKAQAEAEAKAAAEAEAKARAEAEALAAAEAEAKARAEAEAKAAAEAEAAALAEAEAQAAAEAKAQAEADGAAQAEAQALVETEAEGQAEAEAAAQAEAETQAQPTAEAEAQAQTDTDAQFELQVQPETEAQTQADADMSAESDELLEAQAEAQSETEAQAQGDSPSEAQDARAEEPVSAADENLAAEPTEADAVVAQGESQEKPLDEDREDNVPPAVAAAAAAAAKVMADVGDESFDAASAVADTPIAGETIASERVAELIDQLGSSPEQRIDPAFEQLTDMKIEDIVKPLEQPAVETQTVEAPVSSIAAETEQATAQAPLTDVAEATVNAQTADAPAEAPSTGVADDASDSQTQQAATTDAGQTPAEADEDYKKAPEGAVEKYFNQEHKEIEMPEKKKKGFWARWFS